MHRERPVPPLEQLRLFGRLAAALPAYLRESLEPKTCRQRIHEGLAQREQNLIRVIQAGVFAVARSPYRRLMEHAGVTITDVAELVREEGVEGALGRLYDAGVYLTHNEFKARHPIVRGSLRLEVRTRDFDNPLSEAHFEGQSGGSRGAETRLKIDLGHYGHSAIADGVLFESQGVLDRPYVLWQPTPPYNAGLGGLLRYAKLGRSPTRWFAQTVASVFGPAWRHALLTRYVIAAGRLHGRPLPIPEHVPLAEAHRVAEHLAALKAVGTPALINSNASSGVRVCVAARDHGLDIAGTVFRLGGEPLTSARQRVIESVGARAFTAYGMSEVGRVGSPCVNPEAPDEVHLLLDRLGVIRRRRRNAADPEETPVNIYTTLIATTPKLMLNVESDDYGVVGERNCGCALGALGYSLHMHTIRSYEKLTSEGMTFLGSDLIRLVEEVLPERFGGAPTDYQLVEGEGEHGLSRVRLLISPRLGLLDEAEVLRCANGFVVRLTGDGVLGYRWREAGTLEIRRDEPHATTASKILALHSLRPKPDARVEADP